jgi:very-short-patch-repair endonuclease
MSTSENDSVLIAILNKQADYHILREQSWYRIPVASAPKPWPPRHLAFYQTKIFGDEAFAVRYFAYITEIKKVARHDLFPMEMPNPKSDRAYYQIFIDHLEQLPQPIVSLRRRRIVFIPTTWYKLHHSEEINDLYNASPLEDRMWAILKNEEIPAERQFDITVSDNRYILDFAIFCDTGKIDVETDGDTYHANPERAGHDNDRNNDLATDDWSIIRFRTKQVREGKSSYCMQKITKTINKLGGLKSDPIVPRKFKQLPEGTAQQLTLFEKPSPYELDDDPFDE